MPGPTNFQLSLANSQWIDINSQFTVNNLPDRVPNGQAIIISSLFNLLNCAPGHRSRIFQPEYGSMWLQFIHEPTTAMTAMKMRLLMVEAIKRWEPRITLDLDNTRIVPDTTIPGYQVRIAFAIPGVSDSQQIQFQVSQ